MAVVAFINCDLTVIGLRLKQSHVMCMRVRDGLVGWERLGGGSLFVHRNARMILRQQGCLISTHKTGGSVFFSLNSVINYLNS